MYMPDFLNPQTRELSFEIDKIGWLQKNRYNMCGFSCVQFVSVETWCCKAPGFFMQAGKNSTVEIQGI